MEILNVLIFSSLAVLANAAYIDIGYCPPLPPVVSPFDVDRVKIWLHHLYSHQNSYLIPQYTGDWFTQWTTPVPYIPEGYYCSRAQYGSFEQGTNNISVYNSGIKPDASDPSASCGWGQPVNPLNPTGELSVHFEEYPEGSPYWVLDTDYETFASGYACTNITLDHPGEAWHLRRQSAWILTRDRIATQETVRPCRTSNQPSLIMTSLLSQD